MKQAQSVFLIRQKDWNAKAFFSFFFIYLILSLFVALPEGTSTLLTTYGVQNPQCAEKSTVTCKQILRISAKATAHQYLSFFGPMDPSSYARGGLLLAGREWGGAYDTVSLSMFQRLKLMNLIGFGLWPPGMYFLNAMPLMVNLDIPLGLYQVVIASALWAISFALLSSILLIRIRLWITIIPSLIVMLFPLFNGYLLRHGAPYSETYGAALMTIGFSLLILCYYRSPNIGGMIIAGLTFALACFFRSQMLPVAVGVSIILVVIYFLTVQPFKKEKVPFLKGLKVATISFLLAFYIPIEGYMLFNRGALFHADYVWELPFSIPDFPNAGAGSWLVVGGMRAACEVDKKRCDYLKKQIKPGVILPHAKTEVLKAFLFHPVDFSLYKLPIAWRYWMETDDQTKIKYDNIIMLTMLVCCLIFMIIRKSWLFLSFTLCTVGLVFAPPFLLHFEERYFYIIKAFVLFLPFWLLFISGSKRYSNLEASQVKN